MLGNLFLQNIDPYRRLAHRPLSRKLYPQTCAARCRCNYEFNGSALCVTDGDAVDTLGEIAVAYSSKVPVTTPSPSLGSVITPTYANLSRGVQGY